MSSYEEADSDSEDFEQQDEVEEKSSRKPKQQQQKEKKDGSKKKAAQQENKQSFADALSTILQQPVAASTDVCECFLAFFLN